MTPTTLLALASTAGILLAATPLASRLPADGTLGGEVTADGADIGGRTQPPGSKPSSPGDGLGRHVVAGPTIEYKVIVNCGANSIDQPDGTISCASAVAACATSTEGRGPQSQIYSRPVGTTAWTYLTMTCLPDQYAAANQARITIGDIQREFDNTPFRTPIGAIQPVGNKTLINLPTYYALTWPTSGYRPGMTKTFTLIGRTITLRLNHGGHVYHFGDGAAAGPTQSLGGPYPTGDITHSYTAPGTYSPTATTTITADFSIDGGAWQPLPGTATRTTTYQPIQVVTATNHLLPNPT